MCTQSTIDYQIRNPHDPKVRDIPNFPFLEKFWNFMIKAMPRRNVRLQRPIPKVLTMSKAFLRFRKRIAVISYTFRNVFRPKTAQNGPDFNTISKSNFEPL